MFKVPDVDFLTMLLIGVFGIILLKQFNQQVRIAPVTAEGGTKPTTCEGYTDAGELNPPCGIECGMNGNEADCLNCETLCQKTFMHLYPGATPATPTATEATPAPAATETAPAAEDSGGEDEDEEDGGGDDNDDGGGDNDSGENAQEYDEDSDAGKATSKRVNELTKAKPGSNYKGSTYAYSFDTILSRL